ncbi:MAG: anhydro-N-acetylmuramic acid kinase [Parvularculaceae bacterium]
MSALTAIGLMSGASLDGVDAAILSTDGENIVEPGPALHSPYDRDLKIAIRRAIKAALEGRDTAIEIGKAAADVTEAHVVAVRKLVETAGLKPRDIDVIGFHGQTILHRPARSPESVGRTWQVGDGALIAAETGIDVVDGFRLADVAAGGEGAPLAPVYHAALARRLGRKGAVGVVTLGKVAGVSYIPARGGDEEIVAFDCGFGVGLIDEWMEFKAGQPMDKDGALARSGRVHAEVLRMMLLNPYMRRKPPKSLDRYDFKLDPVLHLSAADGAATLTAFAAACVRASVELLPEPPATWIVCGGGRRNPALMEALETALSASVLSAEAAGWRGDTLDAECIAYLSVRSLKKLPLSFPRTTRVPRPTTGGVLRRTARRDATPAGGMDAGPARA